MPRLLFAFPCLFLASLASVLHGQQSAVEIRTSIASVQANAPQWQRLVDSVKIEDLPIEYATGTRYKLNQTVLGEDLKVLLAAAERAAAHGKVADEVVYLSSVQEFQSQLQQFSALVGNFSVADVDTTAKVQKWSVQMSDLANGPVEAAFVAAFGYTIRHAAQIDKPCGAKTGR